jgi:hypothetical protein
VRKKAIYQVTIEQRLPAPDPCKNPVTIGMPA